jgi:NAD(P)H-dependent FMN reductase
MVLSTLGTKISRFPTYGGRDMSGRNLIAALSTRPQACSKTSAIIQNLIQSVDELFGLNSDFFELSELSASLRAASFRVELAGPAKYALDSIEQSKLLIVGISVKAPTGYPALLRYLFEMADPAALRGKSTVLIETHCNASTAQGTELDIHMLMRSFGLNVLSDMRVSSRELLRGVIPGDGRIQAIVDALYDTGFNSDDFIEDQSGRALIR